MKTYSQQEIQAGSAMLARMLPFMTEGMSMEKAGEAVLKRDQELYDLVVVDKESEISQEIRNTIAASVYKSIRGVQ